MDLEQLGKKPINEVTVKAYKNKLNTNRAWYLLFEC